MIEERKAEREALERKPEREAELAMKRVELELKRVEKEQTAGKRVSDAEGANPFKINDVIQPFKAGEDIGRLLVNFERTGDKIGWSRDTWPQLLLSLLPCEAAQVVTRLSAEGAANYDAVRLALQKVPVVHGGLPTPLL